MKHKDPEEGVDYQMLTVWTVTAWFANPGRHSHTWSIHSKDEQKIRGPYDEIVQKMTYPTTHGSIITIKIKSREDTLDVSRIQHIELRSISERHDMQGRRLYSYPVV